MSDGDVTVRPGRADLHIHTRASDGVSDVATILGVWGQVSTAGLLFALPVAVFEFCVGVHLTVKGFRSAGLAALDAPSGSTRGTVAAA